MPETENDSCGPSNAELQRLIERTLTRFQNWRVEVERNPNPRMVHQLKNIVSIIDSLSQLTEGRMKYSYKQLVHRMALLMNEVAQLNLRISNALADDDYLDEDEERQVTAGLVSLVQSAVSMIGMVQEQFGSKRRLAADVQGIPVDAGLEAYSTQRTLSGADSSRKIRS